MNTKIPKRLSMMTVLEILKKYTDDDHRLSQKEIQDILEREYDIVVTRKTVKRNLADLLELGYNLEYSESIRKNRNGEEETVLTDWYYVREFTNSELRLLIDSLLFSKHIPYSQCRELVEKLEGLSNIYFRSRVQHIRTLPNDRPNNGQLFYTIDVLDDAISRGRQVKFHYLEADIHRELHPRKNEVGEPREYIVNPYQMAAINGRYYLICNLDKYDNVSNYRVDRISDIELLTTPVKDKKLVKGLENGLDLPRHIAKHLYMFSGQSVRVRFLADKIILNDLVDWFGEDARFVEKGDKIEVTATVNEKAMFLWALQYLPYVEVVAPARLREEIVDSIKAAPYNTSLSESGENDRDRYA